MTSKNSSATCFFFKFRVLQGVGYKTTLVPVVLKGLVMRPHFFEVPKWLSIKPY